MHTQSQHMQLSYFTFFHHIYILTFLHWSTLLLNSMNFSVCVKLQSDEGNDMENYPATAFCTHSSLIFYRVTCWTRHNVSEKLLSHLFLSYLCHIHEFVMKYECYIMNDVSEFNQAVPTYDEVWLRFHFKQLLIDVLGFIISTV